MALYNLFNYICIMYIVVKKDSGRIDLESNLFKVSARTGIGLNRLYHQFSRLKKEEFEDAGFKIEKRK